jgi:hypothetical protein
MTKKRKAAMSRASNLQAREALSVKWMDSVAVTDMVEREADIVCPHILNDHGLYGIQAAWAAHKYRGHRGALCVTAEHSK